MSYNKRLEDRIDHYLIDNEELYKNKRLGWVGWLLNGNMCFGIYDQLLIVRLSPSLAHTLTKKKGVDVFKQAEDTRGEILAVSHRLYQDDRALQKFVDHSMKFTATLAPKEEDQWTDNLK